MRRDRLLLTEILHAAERIASLIDGRSARDFEVDRDRQDALLWNYAVLGEAVIQLSEETKSAPTVIDGSAPQIATAPLRLSARRGPDC